MAHVDLTFSPIRAHVRTARLVAVALARRAGLDEDLLDELRLAVGEACARAVSLHEASAPERLVAVAVEVDAQDRFTVTVTDEVAGVGESDGDHLGDLDDALTGPMGLALLEGLVDDVEVRSADSGTSVTMRWPLPPGAPGLPVAGGSAAAARVDPGL